MMETIKVNMTPCEDVQTIHASQNDNEAREWGFELHNNGEKIDSSSISDQMVFKAYEGGTEQILPENGSTPTTSPFKGDIKYPQGLLSDQEFLYRESPTEEDGLAFIESIKGNTIVWNQLVQNGNFADTSNWITEYSTFTVSNNVVSVVGTRNGNNYIMQNYQGGGLGHKYYFRCEYYTPEAQDNILIAIYTGSTSDRTNFMPTEYGKWLTYEAILDNHATDTVQYQIRLQSRKQGITNQFRNCMVVDLTQMGLNSITSVDEFKALFPLPFYDYNQGTLLSFMGNGIKTVGKNLFDEQIELGTIGADGNNAVANNRWRSKNYIPCFPNTRYAFSKNGVLQTVNFQFYDANKNYLYNGVGGSAITTPSNAHYLRFFYDSAINVSSGLQLEFGTTPTSYEPYTSSTLSLPISTYFPNGMDGVGTDYDELTNTKATTRMARVDLGTIAWGYNTTWSPVPRFYSPANAIPTKIPGGNIIPNFRCVKYKAETSNNVGSSADYDKCISVNPDKRVYIQDSSFTDPTELKASLSGVYLVYPLATPTETSFTTASLVTENAEIPLSNNDGTLIGKCTEQLSENPGFIDAKIKLADEDGECYSNKIQLHVERSPQ